MVLTELSNVTNLVNIPASTAHADTLNLSLAYLNPNDTAYSLNNYVTFLMVRHPFERLLSAYRNKFEDTSPSAKYFQVSIKKCNYLYFSFFCNSIVLYFVAFLLLFNIYTPIFI